LFLNVIFEQINDDDDDDDDESTNNKQANLAEKNCQLPGNVEVISRQKSTNAGDRETKKRPGVDYLREIGRYLLPLRAHGKTARSHTSHNTVNRPNSAKMNRFKEFFIYRILKQFYITTF